MLRKRMVTYHYKRKSMTAVLSLFLLSCSSSVVDKDESFNHPVFQSFADFCLSLANTEDGYSDENIKNFANLAKLQAGKLSESILERQPTAIYHSGDINNGSEIFVWRRLGVNGRDTCSSSYRTEALPSADQFTTWLHGLDSGWSLTEDTSQKFSNEGREDVYGTSVKYCKSLSKNSSVKIFYNGLEGLYRPPNPNSAYLHLKNVDEDCPQPSKQ